MRLDGIGDGVLACAFLEKLPLLYPGAALTVLCDRTCTPLYACLPEVDAVIAVDKHALEDQRELRRCIELARRAEADLLLNCTQSPSRAVCDLLLGIGAPLVTTGIDSANLSLAEKRLFEQKADRLAPLKAGQRMDIERLADMLAFLGLPLQEPLLPRFQLCPEAEQEAGALLEKHGLASGAYAVLFAGGSTPFNSYYGWGEALGPICLERGLTVLALGGHDTVRVNGHNLEVLSRQGVVTLDFCGRLPLQLSAALIGRARLALGADTGLAHVACALKRPLVALLGGGTFGRFLPYSGRSLALCLPLDCYNCNWRCRHQRAHCMTDILPEVVRVAVKDLLDEARPPERALFMQGPGLFKERSKPVWQAPAAFIRQARHLPGNPLRVKLVDGF